MEAKDYVYALGILATLALGIWNLVQGQRSARKASFINTVTSQRVLWLEQMRQDVGKFIGLTNSWVMSEMEGTAKGQEMVQEIDRLRHVIRLRLNPKDAPDIEIASLIKKIPDLTHESQQEELRAALEALTVATQKMLKEEWDKVKRESKDGDLGEIKANT
jgi:hypothetical protein